MKKALMLVGLVLCVSQVYAADTRSNKEAEGKKRNEEAYERMLEQTGWKNTKTTLRQNENSPRPGDQNQPQPRSS